MVADVPGRAREAGRSRRLGHLPHRAGVGGVCDNGTGRLSVVMSEHHRMRRPDPDLFRVSLKELGMSADECVFVDDTESYFRAAEELGFAGVHAQQPAQTISGLETLLGVALTEGT
ncbi:MULTISPECIES: HAD-IA family hydrolase [unclassified Streptomyces]|uniref:HAD-IA family hydrolase n=2 Tax=Streptomyces TaxID=1883 RepID=UPI003663709D